MAKKTSRRFTGNRLQSKEELENIAKEAMANEIKKEAPSPAPVEKKEMKKKKNIPKAKKVLYVSAEHHQRAKANAFMKGFPLLRDYIEHLIDKDNKNN